MRTGVFALIADDEVWLGMHRVLRGGAELIIDRQGITVAARSLWNETPDAAWRLILAVDGVRSAVCSVHD